MMDSQTQQSLESSQALAFDLKDKWTIRPRTALQSGSDALRKRTSGGIPSLKITNLE
jgi:hypothetical protein